MVHGQSRYATDNVTMFSDICKGIHVWNRGCDSIGMLLCWEERLNQLSSHSASIFNDLLGQQQLFT